MSTPSSGTRALIRAEEELYELLMSMSVARGERPRTSSVTSPSQHSRHMLPNTKHPYARPLSDITTSGLGTSSLPGSARVNGLYADNVSRSQPIAVPSADFRYQSDAMLAATMSVISD